MIVQIALLLVIAVLLMRPWRLATQRRCELCRSSTPKKAGRCRFCGATPSLADDELRAPAPSDRWRTGDQLGEALWGREQVGVGDELGHLGPVQARTVEP